MSFWEDASPIVKVAMMVGAVGMLYFAGAYLIGWPPFAAGCSYTDESGAAHSGCESGSACVSGECVQQSRGLSAN